MKSASLYMFQIDVIVDEKVEMWSEMRSDMKNNEVLTDAHF